MLIQARGGWPSMADHRGPSLHGEVTWRGCAAVARPGRRHARVCEHVSRDVAQRRFLLRTMLPAPEKKASVRPAACGRGTRRGNWRVARRAAPAPWTQRVVGAVETLRSPPPKSSLTSDIFKPNERI